MLSPDRLRLEVSGHAVRLMDCTLLALSLAGSVYLDPWLLDGVGVDPSLR